VSLVDVEALVSQYLRAQSEVTAYIGQRFYTSLPADPEFPCGRVVRIGGAPKVSRPLVVDSAHLQIDVFGGSKATAFDTVDAIRQELAKLVDEDPVQPLGVVCGVRFGPLAYLPDESYVPAKPRYAQDVTVTVRPAPLPTT
jgi:hypothetical protein